MKIVMVTKFVPWPPDSGGKRRSLAVLEALAELGEVTLCAFEDSSARPEELAREGLEVRAVPWRPAPGKALVGLTRTGSVTAARFWDRELARVVRDATGDGVDHLQVEYVQLSPYAHGVPAAHRLLDMHNVESALAASYAASRRGPATIPYLLEARALRRLEKRALLAFDTIAVVGETDRRRLGRGGQTVVVPNGWTPTAEALAPADDPVATFVALMGWRPNDDAARWLCGAIWPLVRARMPEARLVLVGRDPSAAVRAFAGDAIEVTGTVPDVRPYMQRARIGLAPLRSGGGSRLKILEALDAGRPVVATSKGVEGLDDLVGDGVVVADDPHQMADAIVALLEDPERADEMGRRGRAAIAERHSWRRALAPLVDVVSSAPKAGRETA